MKIITEACKLIAALSELIMSKSKVGISTRKSVQLKCDRQKRNWRMVNLIDSHDGN